MRKLVFVLTLAFAIGVTAVWWDGFSAPARTGAAPALQPVVIDFENLSPGPLSNQFANLGVTFNNMTVVTYSHLPGFTHSSVKAAEQCFAQDFCATPIELNFTSPQRRVKLWAGLSAAFNVSSTVIMRALDAGGAQIGQATTVFNPSSFPQAIQRPLEIALPSASIRRVVVSFASGGANFLAIDDIEFDSAGPPPACPATQNPTLTLIQPAGGQTVQFDGFILEARVTSQDPLANHLTLTVNGPGGATRTSVLSLANGKFGPTMMNGYLFPGLNTVIVKFQDCRNSVQSSRTINYTPIPADTRFELLSIEVTQATQHANNGVPLVANKKALARVFLRVHSPLGPNASIFGVHGRLLAQRRQGTGLGDFLPPGELRSLNRITAIASPDLAARRLQFDASVNFELPDGWTTAGDLHLSFRPEIQGSPSSPSNLPCVNCDNVNPLNPALPIFVRFQVTRPMNLILAPFAYHPRDDPEFPLSPDLLSTPAGALQWVNNVFPLAGDFPSNTAGINLLRILPMQTTTRDMQTGDGKDAFLSDLRGLLAILKSQGGLPSDVRLLGMVPCGCGGEAGLNEQVGFADTWASENGPVVPELHFEDYGSTWAHELGHTFGRSHAGNWHGEAGGGGFDSNFPFFHGGIGQPGLALITEWWRPGGAPYFIAPGVATPTSLDRHAHDFMAYGQNDPPMNTGFWVSPYTYTALFDKFKLSTRQGLQPGTSPALAERARPVEKLVALGQINADGTVDLRPFYRANTTSSSGDGAAGEFSLELLGSKNEALVEYRFDAQESSHGAEGAMGFTEFVHWHADAKRIVLKRKEAVLAERRVSARAPTVRVLSPNGGEWVDKETTITWEASDPDGDPLSYTVLYNTGTDATWWPIASGVTATSISVDTSLWPGSAQGRVMVRVTDGVHTAEDVADNTFTVPQKNPLVAILNAEVGNERGQEAPTQLMAVAYDPEDGLLPESSLTWASDRDGLLESGRQVKLENLSPGNHVITLIVIDSQGQMATAQVTKIVRGTEDKQRR